MKVCKHKVCRLFLLKLNLNYAKITGIKTVFNKTETSTYFCVRILTALKIHVSYFIG